MPPLTSQENQIQAGRDTQVFGFDLIQVEDHPRFFLPNHAAHGFPTGQDLIGNGAESLKIPGPCPNRGDP
jgi:hypothetical protein